MMQAEGLEQRRGKRSKLVRNHGAGVDLTVLAGGPWLGGCVPETQVGSLFVCGGRGEEEEEELSVDGALGRPA